MLGACRRQVETALMVKDLDACAIEGALAASLLQWRERVHALRSGKTVRGRRRSFPWCPTVDDNAARRALASIGAAPNLDDPPPMLATS